MLFGDENYATMTDSEVTTRAVLIGCLTGFLTMPLPDKLMVCFYEKIRPIQNEQEQNGNDASNSKKRNKKNDEEANDQDQEFSQRCLKWKLAFIALTYLSFVAYWCILIACMCSAIDQFYIDPRESSMFALAFGIAIIGGIFLYNIFRILLLAKIVPKIAAQQTRNEIDDEEVKRSCCYKSLICMMVPQESVDLCIDVQTVFVLTRQINFVDQKGTIKKPKTKDNLESPNTKSAA